MSTETWPLELTKFFLRKPGLCGILTVAAGTFPAERGHYSIMIEKIRFYVKKYWDILTYLFFGGLTTAVNFLVFLPCHDLLKLSATLSNIIAWVFAVAFAYLTNKPFVFHSHDWSMKTVGPELSKFLAARVTSGVMETAIMFLCVDLLKGNGLFWKIIASILVIIFNYVASKLVVFKNR